MSKLILASILITIAALIYTAGFIQSLRKSYPSTFYLFPIGYLFDIAGTYIMYLIIEKITWNIHTALGIPGFILMFITTILGIILYYTWKRRKALITWFRYVEFSAYTIWMASYVLGVTSHI